MSKRWKITAEVEGQNGDPEVGDRLHADSGARGFNGTITSVTPLRTAEETLAEVAAICAVPRGDAHEDSPCCIPMDRIAALIRDYRGEKE